MAENEEWDDKEDDTTDEFDGFDDGLIDDEKPPTKTWANLLRISEVESFVNNAKDDYQINLTASIIREIASRAFFRGLVVGGLIVAAVVGVVYWMK